MSKPSQLDGMLIRRHAPRQECRSYDRCADCSAMRTAPPWRVEPGVKNLWAQHMGGWTTSNHHISSWIPAMLLLFWGEPPRYFSVLTQLAASSHPVSAWVSPSGSRIDWQGFCSRIPKDEAGCLSNDAKASHLKWRFPKMEVPLNHPFEWDFPL